MQVEVRAAECLIAIKLWKNRYKKLPADLAPIVRAAGLARVPNDSFSGQPLRIAVVGGEPLVYSVGKDGRDDRGRIEFDKDRNSGDLLFRLPTIKKEKR